MLIVIFDDLLQVSLTISTLVVFSYVIHVVHIELRLNLIDDMKQISYSRDIRSIINGLFDDN